MGTSLKTNLLNIVIELHVPSLSYLFYSVESFIKVADMTRIRGVLKTKCLGLVDMF